jgi:hypothetical protein
MERTPWAELAFTQGIDRRPHIAKMRRTIAFHHAGESRGIGVRASARLHRSGSPGRHGRVAAGTQDTLAAVLLCSAVYLPRKLKGSMPLNIQPPKPMACSIKAPA